MEQSLRLRKRRPRFLAMPSFPTIGRKITVLARSARCWPAIWLFLFLLANSAQAQSSAHSWRDHLTRPQVITALGEPTADASVGDTEMMMYKGDLVVKIQHGEVAEIDGTVPDSLKSPEVLAASAAAAAATVPPPAPADATADAASKAAPPAPAPAAASAAATNSDEQVSEKLINDFSTTSIVPPGTSLSGVITKALGPGDYSAAGTSPVGPQGLAALAAGTDSTANGLALFSQPNNIRGFLAGLLLKTILMTLVLKGAFAYKDFPLLWRDAAMVAIGTALCDEILLWLFSLNDFGKIAGIVQADQIVAGMVLMALITTFTAAKEIPTVFGIMAVAIGANTALQFAQVFFW